MLKVYRMKNTSDFEKYEFQQRSNKKIPCDTEFVRYGVLLDSFLMYCKNGLALFLDHYVNPNNSDYIVYFARYSDTKSYYELWNMVDKIQYEEETEE